MLPGFVLKRKLSTPSPSKPVLLPVARPVLMMPPAPALPAPTPPQWTPDASFSQQAVLKILGGVAAALAYLHSLNICHGGEWAQQPAAAYMLCIARH